MNILLTILSDILEISCSNPSLLNGDTVFLLRCVLVFDRPSTEIQGQCAYSTVTIIMPFDK
jgi:hypothetical protein